MLGGGGPGMRALPAVGADGLYDFGGPPSGPGAVGAFDAGAVTGDATPFPGSPGAGPDAGIMEGGPVATGDTAGFDGSLGGTAFFTGGGAGANPTGPSDGGPQINPNDLLRPPGKSDSEGD